MMLSTSSSGESCYGPSVKQVVRAPSCTGARGGCHRILEVGVHSCKPFFRPRVHHAAKLFTSHAHGYRHRVVARASKDDGSNKEDPRKVQQDSLIDILTTNAGLTGTVALVLGYILNVEPLGQLHWDTHHVILGLELAVPLLIADALLMLPDYSNKNPKILAEAKLAAAREAAAAKEAGLASGGEAAISSSAQNTEANKGDAVGMKIRQRAPRSPLLGAMHRLQQTKIFSNPGLKMSIPMEAFALLPIRLADEMLYRGVILAGVSVWLTDRLYEADIDDVVQLGSLTLSPLEFACWLTLTAGALTLGALWLRKLFVVPKFSVMTSEIKEGKFQKPTRMRSSSVVPSEVMDGKLQKNGMVRPMTESATKAQKIIAEVSQRHQYVVMFEAFREMMEWTCLGASFILTGNLAAPLAGSLASEALFSVYQRLKLKAAMEAQRRQLKEVMGLFKDIKKDLNGVIAAAEADMAVDKKGAGKKDGSAQ